MAKMKCMVEKSNEQKLKQGGIRRTLDSEDAESEPFEETVVTFSQVLQQER